MRRGLRYLPVQRRGGGRLGLLGLGIVAALSLVWQQQATLASYVDVESGTATFTSATLPAITPTFTTTAASASGSWSAASGSWASPDYVLTGATTSTGGGATQVYSGPATSYSQWLGGTTTTATLTLTDISAGGTHACGISRGQLFCWGANGNGALGLGATTSTSTPTLVSGGLANKTVTDVSAGADHTCAVADGAAYCWGNVADGRTGTGASANLTTPTTVTASGVLSGKTVTAISVGGAHSCALAGGLAYCWGLNANGQVGNSTNTNANAPVAVTAAAGLLSGKYVTSISAGANHSCAVADGLAYCWGDNASGQLGNNSMIATNAPVAVTSSGVLSGRAVSAVSAGASHSCAVADSTAFCWGLNSNGQLGDASTTQRLVPVAAVGTVAANANVTAISAGATHSCAIAGGTAHCWGANGSGQVGNGSTATSVGSPVAVTASGVLSGRTLTSISAGTTFTCTTGFTSGSCWGLGTSGQLGNKASSASSTAVDVAITGPTCGTGSVRMNTTDCSLAQSTDYWGRLGYRIGTWTAPNSAWVKVTTDTRGAVSPSASARTATSLSLGWSQPSELNKSYGEYTLQRSTSPSGSNPVTLYRGGSRTTVDRGGFAKRTSNLNVTQVSAATDHSCEILEGLAYCWGDNTNGELGIGSTTDASVPTPVVTSGVLAGKTVTAISAALDDANDGQSTCAIADGGVYCWGANAYGELGNGTTAQSTTPVQAGTLSNVTAIATGYMHTCALTGGKVYCWGDNSRGQLGIGSTTDSATPVLVQGLLANKTVTAISTGAAHTCAIAGGGAYCWGSNVSGQLGINNTTNQSLPTAVLATGALSGLTVTQVAAGQAHTCVIAGGKPYCWGYNNNGQLGNNSTATSNVPVAVVSLPWAANAPLSSLSAGQYSNCVVAAGKGYCWGDNSNGQLGNGNTTDQRTPVAVSTSGVLSGTVDQINAGAFHSCAIQGSATYCWGYNRTGQLGDGSTTQRTAPFAVTPVAGAPCDAGAKLITPNTCSLASGTTYFYRLTYTIDGGMSTASGWVGIKTN